MTEKQNHSLVTDLYRTCSGPTQCAIHDGKDPEFYASPAIKQDSCRMATNSICPLTDCVRSFVAKFGSDPLPPDIKKNINELLISLG